MIRTTMGIMILFASLFQADPLSKWGMIVIGFLLMIWDGIDSNGEKLDLILENQKIINKNIKKEPE